MTTAIHVPRTFVAFAVAAIGLGGCGGDSDGNSAPGSGRAILGGNFAIAYVKRPVASLGNPTDGVKAAPGGDLYLRDLSSASAPEQNITARYTEGRGDVSDPEVSDDGRRLVFSMRGPDDPTWDIWEYAIASDTLRPIMSDTAAANQGDDVDPAYLPDGRIVFSSNRQARLQEQLKAAGVEAYTTLDEYNREPALTLHVVNSDGTNIRQISFNQSHDRNPTVLSSGEVLFSRWDHLGPRNQFSIFFTNPDGTNLFVLYGAHSPGNSFLHPREMQDGRLISTLMPLSGTREGGALVVIDARNFADHDDAGPGAAAGSVGQFQPTLQEIPLDAKPSDFGRYTTPYPLWDGSNRVLVSWTPSQPTDATDPLTGETTKEEGTPVYGVYMLDLDDKTLKPVVLAPRGYAVLDPVPVMARPAPNVIDDKPLDPDLAAAGMGILDVKSVYDTDRLERMGAAVLTADEQIPRIAGPANDSRTEVADLATLKDPTKTTASARPARFVRVSRAVPTPPGLSRAALGDTDFEMQQILGYAEIEPDGSFRVKVPADTPLSLAVLDSAGRAFTPHTSWLQVRPGETRTCNGCHAPRRGAALNVDPIAGTHPELFGINTPGLIHVHPGISANGVLRAVDPEGDALTYRITTAPRHGTVNLTDAVAGTFTYTANADAPIGQDSFQFVANDGTADSNVATITINIHSPPNANTGESMAETRARFFPEVAELRADLIYEDVWGARSNPCIAIRYTANTTCLGEPRPSEDLATAVPVGGVINFPDHIAPLFIQNRGTNTCAHCHNNDNPADPMSVGLDLRDVTTGTGRLAAYQSLVVGRPELNADGQPIVEMIDGVPQVRRSAPLLAPGSARSSYLVEKLFGQELRAEKTLTGQLDHSTFLNRAEKRLLVEWVDVGAQYYNDPYAGDTNGNGALELAEVRGAVQGLSVTTFNNSIHRILLDRCAGCHRPSRGEGEEPAAGSGYQSSRFVLTGNPNADFNITASMVSDIANPASSYLLSRPASDGKAPNPVHPQIPSSGDATASVPVLSPTQPADADVATHYQAIVKWIEAAAGAANGAP